MYVYIPTRFARRLLQGSILKHETLCSAPP